MGREIVHPPSPTGATTRERDIIHRLHRAATTIHDHERRPIMLEGIGLLVDLIEARNRRQSFTDQFEQNQTEGWTE